MSFPSDLIEQCKESARIAALPSPRFCLVKDDDSHWYLIPADKKDEWEAWVDNQDWAISNPPAYAQMIDGPHTLTFADPQ